MNDHRPKCSLIGAGRAGRALSLAMAGVGYRFDWIISNNPIDTRKLALQTSAEHHGVAIGDMNLPAEFLILAIPDSALSGVVPQLVSAGIIERGVTIAAHLSGALGSVALDGLRDAGASVMAFHPAQTFTPESDPGSVFKDICFDMEGDDRACECGETIAGTLGAVSVKLDPAQRIQTHLAMTIASNYTVAVIRVAEDIMKSAGIKPGYIHKMLRPLYLSTVSNVAEQGTMNALTGPVSRGDIHTVRAHLKALENSPAEHLAIYKELAGLSLDIAVERGSLTSVESEEMRKLLL